MHSSRRANAASKVWTIGAVANYNRGLEHVYSHVEVRMGSVPTMRFLTHRGPCMGLMECCASNRSVRRGIRSSCVI